MLANVAEQHHRLRRRGRHEQESRVGGETLEAVFAELSADGLSREGLREAAGSVDVQLVLAAHPTEATWRTVLAAHVRIAKLLDRLDASATPSARAALHRRLAEEIAILWQTDEVRSRRPQVANEIDTGLWFVERSLWLALSALVQAWRAHAAPRRRRLPGSALGSAGTRTATRT